jgi:hypothetical protein
VRKVWDTFTRCKERISNSKRLSENVSMGGRVVSLRPREASTFSAQLLQR